MATYTARPQRPICVLDLFCVKSTKWLPEVVELLPFRKDWHDSSHLAGIDGEDQVLGVEDQIGAASFDKNYLKATGSSFWKLFVGSKVSDMNTLVDS